MTRGEQRAGGRHDDVAVAALVVGLTSIAAPVLVPIATGLGIAGAVRATRPGGRGTGHALAGLLVSGLVGSVALVAILGSVAWSSAHPDRVTTITGAVADRWGLDAPPAFTDGGDDPGPASPPVDTYTADLGEIYEGHCLLDLDDSEVITTVDVVDCSVPHAYEVIGIFPDVGPDGPYPGEDAEYDRAYTACRSRLIGAAGVMGESSADYEVETLYPSAEGWDQGDRWIYCLAFRADGDDLVGGPFLTEEDPPLPSGPGASGSDDLQGV